MKRAGSPRREPHPPCVRARAPCQDWLCLVTATPDDFIVSHGKGEVVDVAAQANARWPPKGFPLTPKDKLVVKFAKTGKPIAKKIANIEFVTVQVRRAHVRRADKDVRVHARARRQKLVWTCAGMLAETPTRPRAHNPICADRLTMSRASMLCSCGDSAAGSPCRSVCPRGPTAPKTLLMGPALAT